MRGREEKRKRARRATEGGESDASNTRGKSDASVQDFAREKGRGALESEREEETSKGRMGERRRVIRTCKRSSSVGLDLSLRESSTAFLKAGDSVTMVEVIEVGQVRGGGGGGGAVRFVCLREMDAVCCFGDFGSGV